MIHVSKSSHVYLALSPWPVSSVEKGLAAPVIILPMGKKTNWLVFIPFKLVIIHFGQCKGQDAAMGILQIE